MFELLKNYFESALKANSLDEIGKLRDLAEVAYKAVERRHGHGKVSGECFEQSGEMYSAICKKFNEITSTNNSNDVNADGLHQTEKEKVLSDLKDYARTALNEHQNTEKMVKLDKSVVDYLSEIPEGLVNDSEIFDVVQDFWEIRNSQSFSKRI